MVAFRKCQSPCELLGRLSGFLSLPCRGIRPCVESGPETEDSSPVLTGILEYFWSIHRGLSFWLEWGHVRSLSSRAIAALSRFSSRGSWICGFPLRLSHEAFPQGCPTCHRGVSRSSAWKTMQCREIRFLWNGLKHLGDSWNGGRTLEFLSPFLWRAPPLEMRWELQEFFPDQAAKGSLISS